MTEYRTKRIYEAPEPSDGERVLVDGLWPRGISKAKARIDRWAKDVAPSTGLRKWFGHDPARWEEFRRRYREELKDRRADLRLLGGRDRRVTLLFSARDAERNQAAVLKEVLEDLQTRNGD